jgi:hypothetical protein
LHRCFTPGTHQNALCDPQITRDARTLLQRNVSWCAFYGNRTRLTPAWKIVKRHFAPQRHWNAVRDQKIPPDVKTQLQCNVSRCTFYRNCTGPTQARKIVCQHFTPRTQWNALRDPQIPPDAKKHKFSVTCPGAFSVKSVQVPPKHEK